MKGFKALFYIFKTFLKRHFLKFYFAIILLILASFFYAIEVYMLKFIFDDLLSPQTPKTSSNIPSIAIFIEKIVPIKLEIDKTKLFVLIPFFLVLIFFLKGFFNFFGKFHLDSVGLLAITDLRDELYKKILYQSHDFFATYPTGTLISRLLNDVERMKTAVSEKLTEISTAFFQLIALLVSAFCQNYKLTFLSLITVPLVVIPISQFSKKLRRVSKRSQEELANLADVMKEILSGILIVQIFQTEKKELLRFKRANEKLFKANLKATRVMALTTPLMELIGGIAIAGILYYGHFKIIKGEITLGSFSAFLGTLYAMYVPIKKLSQANNIVQQAVAAAERSIEILTYPPQVKEPIGALELKPFSKSIKFENVSFSYDGKNMVLKDINLEIPYGKKIALVGRSGVGKTTFIKLIPRLFDVTIGAIKIDDVDIRTVTLKSLRKQIAVVTQDTILFNLSVKENIAYGNEEASMEEVVEAAKKAKAHDFILSLPNGYETMLGEGGFSISGGERQRIAIARALLKNPSILILDEATSSLDALNEHLVSEAIKELMAERTTIVIAHRIKTVINADLIVVLDEGKIIDMGKHEELYKRCKIYNEICGKELELQEGESIY